MNTLHLALFFFAASASASACATVQSRSVEAFSLQYSCPSDRVTVRPRPDVDAAPELAPAAPPADIASDPARAAMWAESRHRRHDEAATGKLVFELRGCDQTAFLACYATSARDPDAPNDGGPICRPLHPQPPAGAPP